MMQLPKLTGRWAEELRGECVSDYYAELERFVVGEYAAHACYPPAERVFEAFRRTPFERVRAVILGQDPYHEPGEAQGLAFYVPEGVRTPPSLRNIAIELQHDLGNAEYRVPDLLSWADQGVLLLNATLTVRGGHEGALSHQKRGWERFTDAAIRSLAERRSNLVFILWGSHAQKKGELIDRERHCVIESPHPSPLSARRGFFGSRPFSQTNAYLSAHGLGQVDWL